MRRVKATAHPTVGEIARWLGVPVHRIEYLVRARGIEPSGWAGHARVFSEAEVERIASELRRIDEDKPPDGHGQTEPGDRDRMVFDGV